MVLDFFDAVLGTGEEQTRAKAWRAAADTRADFKRMSGKSLFACACGKSFVTDEARLNHARRCNIRN